MTNTHKQQALLRAFRNDMKGHIAVFTALLGLPLIGMASFAVDYNRHHKLNTTVSDALDAAALATVSNATLTSDERKAFAEKTFWENYGTKTDRVKFNVNSVDAEKISISAVTMTDTTVAAAIGLENIKSKEHAAAVITKGDVICMLALDKTGTNTFEVVNGGIFNAPTCSVQVNSIHPNAAKTALGGTATAKDFCVSGGVSGTFTPFANTQCTPVTDPYASVKTPLEEPCVDQAELNKTFSDWRIYTSGVSLKPGTYCGGLNLTSYKIRFEPGVYVMKDGPLVLDSGAALSGDEVSIILSGPNSTITVKNGSLLDIRAQSTGPLAGLAIFEQTGAKKIHTESIFTGGGNTIITGTVYLPTQQVTFIDGGQVEAQAPATSFIANNFKITRGAHVEVKVDHRAAGLPPLLPRSDESVRLIE